MENNTKKLFLYTFPRILNVLSLQFLFDVEKGAYLTGLIVVMPMLPISTVFYRENRKRWCNILVKDTVTSYKSIITI